MNVAIIRTFGTRKADLLFFKSLPEDMFIDFGEKRKEREREREREREASVGCLLYMP